MYSEIINGRTVEYDDESHSYLVDGILTKSVTTILNELFPDKYANIPIHIMNNAAARGTRVHKCIEEYETLGKEEDLEELQDYKFLKKYYKFEVLENERMIFYIHKGFPLFAGRFDMTILEDGKLLVADIKTTATLDMISLSYQLSMYAMGYEQCYGKKIEGLRAIHLKNGKRKYKEVKRLTAEEILKEVAKDD